MPERNPRLPYGFYVDQTLAEMSRRGLGGGGTRSLGALRPASIASSTIVLAADDCVRRPYPVDTAFVDLGHGDVHSAFNPSSTDVTVLVATFFEAPASGPLVIPAEAPAGCVLP